MTAGDRFDWRSIAALAATCAIALALRLPGVTAHLPDIYWHDELNFIEGALRVGAGEIITASYGGYAHGTLTYYVLFAAFAVFYLVGRAVGTFGGPSDLVMSYVTDPTAVFLVARSVMLAATLATVVLTFVLTRRLFGFRAGWMAALLLAVSFQSVQITLGKEDGLLTLLVLTTVWLVVRSIDAPPTMWRFAVCGVAAGAATAVKYFGVFLVPVLLAAVYLSRSPQARSTQMAWRAVATVGAMAIVFLCLVPGVVFDTDRFVNSFRALAGTNTSTLFSDRDIAFSPWYGYLWYSLALTNGVIAAALFYVSAGWLISTRPRHAAVVLLYPFTLFTALTFTLLFGRPGEAANFYQVSALPLLFVVLGGFLARASTSGGPARVAVAGALVAIIATNVVDDLRFQRLLQLPDSRTVTRQWIERNVPRGSSILVEGARGSFMLEGPQLRETTASLTRVLEEIRREGGGGGLWSAKLQAAQARDTRPRFDVRNVLDLTPELLASDPQYVVVRSERSRRLVEASGRYRGVFAIESPSAHLFQVVPMLSSADIARLRAIPLAGGDAHLTPGPSIAVYQAAEPRRLRL